MRKERGDGFTVFKMGCGSEFELFRAGFIEAYETAKIR
jgi:hypothetical protein